MSNSYHTKNGHTSKRGAFVNGVWLCDCEPRLPAEKFQTKNGGKNHGRWFYTCQKPQPKRCSFFLWSDDAKIREEAAVINNSRTEPNVPSEPVTPKKPPRPAQSPNPFSKTRSEALSNDSPTRKPWSPDGYEENFEWSSSDDEELASIVDAVTEDGASPRKTLRTPLLTSPGKRTHSGAMKTNDVGESWSSSNEMFLTPTTSNKSTGLLTPLDTEPKTTSTNYMPPPLSSLTADVLKTLKPIDLPSQIEHELIELLHKHELRAQGIARGRDITRVAVQSRERTIADLQARVTALEAEKETSRAVIAHLKQDIATSPKRPSRSRFGSRSEI